MKDSIKRIVSSEQMIEQCCREMRQMLEFHGYINFEIKRGSRSRSQENLYWEWMTIIGKFMENYREPVIDEETGELLNTEPFNKDDAHDLMRSMFLGTSKKKQLGKTAVKDQLKSTTGLTKGEYHHYMSQIQAWAGSVKVILPVPEDSQYMQLQEAQNG